MVSMMKDCLVEAILLLTEVEVETGFQFNNKSEAILRLAISGFIQNAKGNGNGNGKDKEKAEHSNGKDVPATEKQLAFLRKHGGKGIILAELTKLKASQLIHDISEGWEK